MNSWGPVLSRVVEQSTRTTRKLARLRSVVEQNGGTWARLFAENQIIVNTPARPGAFTPVFCMGRFFHWSFVQQVKPWCQAEGLNNDK